MPILGLLFSAIFITVGFFLFIYPEKAYNFIISLKRDSYRFLVGKNDEVPESLLPGKALSIIWARIFGLFLILLNSFFLWLLIIGR